MSRPAAELREKAREGIRSGKLPSQRPRVTWGGVANGARCAVCDNGFSHGDLEIEFEDEANGAANGDRIQMHVPCHTAWEAELSISPPRIVSSSAANTPRAPDDPQTSTG